MPGLIRGVARTAVIAGTATAVSGRVQRRQAEKYADRDAQIAYEQQQAYEAQMPQQPQVVYAQPAPAPAPPPPPPAAPAEDDVVAQIQKLGQLHSQGLLTDEEFTAAKAKLLA